jgi:hypothetical protein
LGKDLYCSTIQILGLGHSFLLYFFCKFETLDTSELSFFNRNRNYSAILATLFVIIFF